MVSVPKQAFIITTLKKVSKTIFYWIDKQVLIAKKPNKILLKFMLYLCMNKREREKGK